MGDNNFLHDHYNLAFLIGICSGVFIFALIMALMVYFHRTGQLSLDNRIQQRLRREYANSNDNNKADIAQELHAIHER